MSNFKLPPQESGISMKCMNSYNRFSSKLNSFVESSTTSNRDSSMIHHHESFNRCGTSNPDPETETRLMRACRRPLQLSVLRTGSSLQVNNRHESSIGFRSLRQSDAHLSRLSSMSEHFISFSKLEKGHTFPRSKDTNLLTSFVQTQAKASARFISTPQRPNFLVPRKTTSENKVKTSNSDTKIQRKVLLRAGTPINSSLTHKQWHKRLADGQTKDTEDTNNTPSDSKRVTARSMTPDRVKRLHDTFHRLNSKCLLRDCGVGEHFEQKPLKVTRTYNMKIEHEGEIKSIAGPRLNRQHTPNEESRICEILKEVVNENRTKYPRNTNIYQSNCSGDSDEIILKPFLRWMECQNLESMVEVTDVPQKPILRKKKVHDGILNEEENRLNAEKDKNDNDGFERVEQDIQESDDGERLDMSDEGIQNLLMPLVLNFLSSQ